MESSYVTYLALRALIIVAAVAALAVFLHGIGALGSDLMITFALPIAFFAAWMSDPLAEILTGRTEAQRQAREAEAEADAKLQDLYSTLDATPPSER